ncbi:Abi family protein [Prevotella sp.]|uniref:Abi family protein n=1 Tax=Prevotella sp. TaxID=59823 RepID=UPI00345DF35C
MIVRIFTASVLAKPLNNAQIVRGVFVYTHLNMANLIPFTKRFESSENLVNLLESRGLQICDRNKAIQYLDNIGYYRLSAYMYPLLKMPKTAHLYKESSTFKKMMMLYRLSSCCCMKQWHNSNFKPSYTHLSIHQMS